MIFRILGEGQYRIEDDVVRSDLETLDNALGKAIETGEGFPEALAALLDAVRSGEHLGDEELVTSDVVLPYAEATIDEVRESLTDEGLIPNI